MQWTNKNISVIPTASYHIWQLSNIRNHNVTGVYVFKDNKNNVIYIGEAVNIASRVKNHIYGTTVEMLRGGWQRIHQVDLYETGTGMQGILDAKFLEKWLISQLHPYLNKGYGQTHPKVLNYLKTSNECRWNWSPADQAACQSVYLPVSISEFDSIRMNREKAKLKRKKTKKKK
ncbi:GIY-YIG nuclease family protein [Gottfriedia acidiceleris]|uniref:GIY-YIG nuclease family protein n=1 Tax=Gottfriedia acidiceleris TaxID=371036 RepID=UPI003D1EE77C